MDSMGLRFGQGVIILFKILPDCAWDVHFRTVETECKYY